MKIEVIPPSIDLVQTGKKIQQLRIKSGYSVKDLQEFFMFENPQAIYKWQQGKNLPTIDNLLALSYLFGCAIEDMLVPVATSERVPLLLAS